MPHSPHADATELDPPAVQERVLCGARSRLYRYLAGSHRLIFLHGLRGDHHGLEPIVARLEGAGIEVVVPDLPGFGGSAPLPDVAHDLAGYTAWTRELLTAVAPDGDAVLAGHSFGSVVAAAAVAGGARVRALVLVNAVAATVTEGRPAPGIRATVAFHRLAGALPERTGTALLRSRAVTRVVSAAMVRTPDRALRRWIHAEHDLRFAGFADRRVLLAAFDASVRHSVGEFAERIAVPTLLVAGERDDITPLDTQRALASRLPGARLVALPGIGHLAHYEDPAAVAAAIAEFAAGPGRRLR